MTAPSAKEFLEQGEFTIVRIDQEARCIWDRIVMTLTGARNASAGIHTMSQLVPTAVIRIFEQTHNACVALNVNEPQYYASLLAAVYGQQVSDSPELNLKHTIIGIKGMHGQALAVQEHLQNQND